MIFKRDVLRAFICNVVVNVLYFNLWYLKILSRCFVDVNTELRSYRLKNKKVVSIPIEGLDTALTSAVDFISLSAVSLFCVF